jgi:hypothetical protein
MHVSRDAKRQPCRSKIFLIFTVFSSICQFYMQKKSLRKCNDAGVRKSPSGVWGRSSVDAVVTGSVAAMRNNVCICWKTVGYCTQPAHRER